MDEPRLCKFPAEIFGLPYTDTSPQASQIRQAQHCPFLEDTCKKPRKSEPHIKVDVCSVGYKTTTGAYKPVIICPHRFEVAVIRQTIQQYYLSGHVDWLAEVSLGATTGSVDYVAVHIVDDEIDDFMCIEIQAAGTTGTPWQAVLDHQRTGQFAHDNYPFGINWANEFAKTMMQQAYKKGLLLERWRKKLVFFVQDVAMDYLVVSYDTQGLRDANDDDTIHFCTLQMRWDNQDNVWRQHLHQRLSTDTDGIRRMLGGLSEDALPTQADFIATLTKKRNQNKR
jgi:hypothetical protein